MFHSGRAARQANINARVQTPSDVDRLFRLITDIESIPAAAVLIPLYEDPAPVVTRDPFVTDLKIRYAQGEFL